jgi:sulfur carrier protein ThiS
MAGEIVIKVAELTKPLSTSRVKAGTTLAGFLEHRKMEYDSSIRVNGVVVAKSYKLRNGDILTIVGEVSGGM